MTSKTQKSQMDRKYTPEFLTTTITNFIQTRLIDHSLRHREKEQSAERLSVSHSSDSAPESFEYSEQAVLANLDWGIDALSEAIATQNSELKLARLAHSERMLQVCALLDPTKSTAGVPNSYLSAWAHLNLAYLSQTRDDGSSSAVFRVFEMFEIDPFFARIDFAPELWEALFLPHMSSIVGWYSEARHRIVMETIPDASDLSLTVDFDDRLFSESLIMSVRPDQAEKLKALEEKYGDSLDCNTRMFAKYYKEVVGDVDTNYGRKGRVALPPIAEPPGSPRREVGRNIPDFVKFGPILPKSAGFMQTSRPGNTRRATAVANFADETENSKKQILTESLLEEDANDSYYKGSDQEITRKTTPKSRNTNCSSPLPSQTPKNESEILLQLLSNWYTSPIFRNEDKSESSPEISSPNRVNEPDNLMRFLSKHSSPMLSSPLHRKTLVHSIDESEMRRSSGNISPSLHNQHYTDHDHASPSSAYMESEEDEGRNSISHPSSEKSTAITRPPKDFICPITGQLFIDPVTLETGQTYERRAIEEWIKRGNTTCPITRQLLSSTSLPRTNYVLKRLITSWIEQNPGIAHEFSYAYTPTSTPHSPISSSKNNSPRNDKRIKRFSKNSPTSVISQAATEKIVNELKPYTSCLCTSEDLQECENAIIEIARILKEVKGDLGIYAYVSKPTILNGFVEVISASVDREVLRTSVYILSELLAYDESVGETLTNVDADFDSIASLLINGLFEAAILIYQLRPSYCQLTRENLVPSLIQVMMNKSELRDNEFLFVMEMKDAAVGLLEQILSGGDEVSRSINASSVVNANGVAVLVKCLDRLEGRASVVGILLNCMRYDKSCKMMIAKRAELLSVLELFHCGDDSTRSICVEFISELTCLNRRTFCNQVLQMIKDEGAFSMMHSLLVYLPMASMEQQPAVASLLLQLDLLVEPRKASIYREEAIDALIEALKKEDFPVCQIIALDALSSLSGRLTSSGVPIIEAWLLKLAGVDNTYDSLVKEDGVRLGNFEKEEAMEEEALSKWEKRVAFVLCNHDSGTIFKALEECLKSNSMEMAKSSLVVCTWLVHMLILLPETGIKLVASRCLLNQIIKVLHSSRNLEEKVLAALCLKTFVTDPDALRELGKQAKCIYKPLRKLKQHSPVAVDTLKAILNLQSVDAAELWYCSELFEIDCTFNGEVLSLVHKEGRLFSSHSDGTIKIWDVGRRGLRLVQEVHAHTKAVTCLYIPPSSSRLYSSSLDKTIRVWEIGQEISRVEVHDMKEIVQCLATSSDLMCFATQGTGVKVTNGNGSIKHVNFNKSVKCLAVEEGNLYCGCTGYSIQEVNLSKCTTSTFYSGTRKILGKQTIHTICAQGGVLYAGGSSVDGLAGKAFSLSTKTVIGSFSTGIDIHCISLNNDFVFTGTRCGVIEVWLKERMARVGSIRVSSKVVTALVSDYEGDMLFSGSSDGKIQVWSLD